MDRTERILEASVERTPGPLVIRVVLEKEVDFAILGLSHQVRFQIFLQFCGGPMRELRHDVYQH